MCTFTISHQCAEQYRRLNCRYHCLSSQMKPLATFMFVPLCFVTVKDGCRLADVAAFFLNGYKWLETVAQNEHMVQKF